MVSLIGTIIISEVQECFKCSWDAEMPDYYTCAIWCEETNRVVIDAFRGRQLGSGD